VSPCTAFTAAVILHLCNNLIAVDKILNSKRTEALSVSDAYCISLPSTVGDMS
jgi:hypothetical protein